MLPVLLFLLLNASMLLLKLSFVPDAHFVKYMLHRLRARIYILFTLT